MKKMSFILIVVVLLMVYPSVLAEQTLLTTVVPNEHTLTVFYEEGGTVVVNGTTLTDGESITIRRHEQVVIEMIPDTGYVFETAGVSSDYGVSLQDDKLVIAKMVQDLVAQITFTDKVSIIPTIAVTPKALTLYMGECSNLTAVVTPKNIDGYSVIWQSSDENIAEVDDTGVVIANKPGKAIITATLISTEHIDNNMSVDTCEVTVLEVEVNLPQTGDSSHIVLWFAMLTLAGTAILTLKRKTA